ncbi:hypothetical protein [Methylobacterium cerastii]|uniref:hypothetical protein n=1 Tax=Methylobacterium cerastii TaxID=932741 RepID=UPI001EE28656|nr:hypothetical protein [Methylobacterium cerastii]
MATRAKPEAGNVRAPLMVRVAPAVRERLDAAAAESGRSLSQEIELRLDRSFELVSVIEAAMESYKSVAASAFSDGVRLVEDHMLEMVGGDDAYMIWYMLSYEIRAAEARSGKTIREDEATRHDAEKRVLSNLPEVFRNLPPSFTEHRKRLAAARADRAGADAPGSIAALGVSLPPLGHKGPWPPAE